MLLPMDGDVVSRRGTFIDLPDWEGEEERLGRRELANVNSAVRFVPLISLTRAFRPGPGGRDGDPIGGREFRVIVGLKDVGFPGARFRLLGGGS